MDHVSIHAPVKGATLRSSVRQRKRKVSIHAPVKGATHLGADLGDRARVSIHAPVKGATAALAGGTYAQSAFQSTRP